MAFARRQFSGSAVATTLSNAINAGDTTFQISTTAGWPDGAGGKFLVVIGRGSATEEKIFVQSRSGSTLTLASASDRGAEGTTDQGHGAGEPVEHVSGSTDADEANNAVHQTIGAITTKGDSLWGSSANNLTRVGVGSNNTLLTADSSTSSGTKWATVDGNSLATSVAGAGLAGGGGSALSVNVDNSTVEISSDTLRIKDLGVTGAKLAAAIVDDSTIEKASNVLRVKDGGITNAKLAGSIALSNITFPAWTTYTPTWTGATSNPSVGNGSLSGAYQILGKTCMFRITLVCGSTTSFGVGAWSFTLGGSVTAVAREQSVAATSTDTDAANRYGGSAIIAASGTTVARIATGTDASVGVSAALPFTWASADVLSITGTIEIA